MKRVPYRSYLPHEGALASSKFRGLAAVLVMIVVGSGFATGLWLGLSPAMAPILVMLIVAALAPFPAAALAIVISESGRREESVAWYSRFAGGLVGWASILAVLVAQDCGWQRADNLGEALGLAVVSGMGGGFAMAFTLPSALAGAFAGRAIARRKVKRNMARDRQARWWAMERTVPWQS